MKIKAILITFIVCCTLIERNGSVHASEIRAVSSIEFLFEVGKKDPNIDAIKLYIDQGNDVNIHDSKLRTALIIATIKNNIEVIKLLLKAPATDVNAENDTSDSTALITALNKSFYDIHNSFAIIKLLLDDSRTDINKGDFLKRVIERQYPDILKLVLQRKDLNINKQFAGGRTALITAINHPGDKREAMVSLLLEHPDNIDLDIEDYSGQTAFDYAHKLGNRKILELLETAQKKKK